MEQRSLFYIAIYFRVTAIFSVDLCRMLSQSEVCVQSAMYILSSLMFGFPLKEFSK